MTRIDDRCRRCAYEDCIVIELKKSRSTQAKNQTCDGPSRKEQKTVKKGEQEVVERKNQKFCLLLASIRADDRVLLSNTFDRVLDLLGPYYAAVVGCRWWVPNSLQRQK